jgi:hypothetical protein
LTQKRRKFFTEGKAFNFPSARLIARFGMLVDGRPRAPQPLNVSVNIFGRNLFSSPNEKVF